MPRTLKLADFDYELPRELIAQAPAQSRSASRLLDVDGECLVDRRFADLPSLLAPNDVAVFNDTRVIRARIFGTKPTGGRVELLIERIVAANEAWAQIKASHPPVTGGRIDLAGGAHAEMLERDERFFRMRFHGVDNLFDWLETHGDIPLPPYIERATEANDRERYQTVYARESGAVAAPTAGLHFDKPLLHALKQRGVELAFVTLHVGAGTFQPVSSENLTEHTMHSERYTIPEATVTAIQGARQRGGRVLAIGTTSLRALESAASDHVIVRAGAGETKLFITPGYRFRVVDLLLTNFHLPRSTLLMLVSAFADHATIRAAYTHAISERYRFFSYGDAMLLRRSRDL